MRCIDCITDPEFALSRQGWLTLMRYSLISTPLRFAVKSAIKVTSTCPSTKLDLTQSRPKEALIKSSLRGA